MTNIPTTIEVTCVMHDTQTTAELEPVSGVYRCRSCCHPIRTSADHYSNDQVK